MYEELVVLILTFSIGLYDLYASKYSCCSFRPLYRFGIRLTSIQVLPFLPDLFAGRLHVPERQSMEYTLVRFNKCRPLADIVSSIPMDCLGV